MHTRTRVAVLAGSADEAEAQFYEALAQGDVERLMALWADDDDIVCVHPGGGRLVGAVAIRASYAALLASGGLALQPRQTGRLTALGAALHHGLERARGPAATTAWVVVSHLFVKTPTGWRLAARHASDGPADAPPAGEPAAVTTLH